MKKTAGIAIVSAVFILTARAAVHQHRFAQESPAALSTQSRELRDAPSSDQEFAQGLEEIRSRAQEPGSVPGSEVSAAAVESEDTGGSGEAVEVRLKGLGDKLQGLKSRLFPGRQFFFNTAKAPRLVKKIDPGASGEVVGGVFEGRGFHPGSMVTVSRVSGHTVTGWQVRVEENGTIESTLSEEPVDVYYAEAQDPDGTVYFYGRVPQRDPQRLGDERWQRLRRQEGNRYEFGRMMNGKEPGTLAFEGERGFFRPGSKVTIDWGYKKMEDADWHRGSGTGIVGPDGSVRISLPKPKEPGTSLNISAEDARGVYFRNVMSLSE